MPSSLLIELLRLILDNFACPPLSNDGTLDNPHRHELLSLCLTSKIFRQIAQPLLFALIAMKTDDFEQTVKALLASDPDGLLLKESRMVILTPSKKECPKTVEKSVLIDFLLVCRGLEEMVGNSLTWEIGLLSRLSTFCFTYCPHAALTSFPQIFESFASPTWFLSMCDTPPAAFLYSLRSVSPMSTSPSQVSDPETSLPSGISLMITMQGSSIEEQPR